MIVVDGQAPRVGASFLTWAEVIILQNDDPHGVVELSISERTVFENFTGPLVNLVRKRGIFGEVRQFALFYFALTLTLTLTDLDPVPDPHPLKRKYNLNKDQPRYQQAST